MRFYLLHRRAPAAVLLSLVTAFVLLAEAMVAVILAPKWHLSWWEWHVLLTFAFGFVAYSAYVQYRREGSSAGLFDAIGAARRPTAGSGPSTAPRWRSSSPRCRSGSAAADRDAASLAARLADRFGLTEGQTAVLDRAGAALATERERTRRLAALVDAGEQARVGLDDTELLDEILRAGPAGLRRHPGRTGLRRTLTVDGRGYDPRGAGRAGPHEVDGRVAVSLARQGPRGRRAGRAEPGRLPGADSPGRRPAVATLATQLSITLENARLYRELGTLFRQYMSPDVAAALLADPDQAALGGSVVEVTALFADLRGFTTFSEGVEPAEIVRMLNRYHGAAVPCILDNGGTIVQFVGDALLALFNAPARQPDHALRAVRAALAMQGAVEEIAAGRAGLAPAAGRRQHRTGPGRQHRQRDAARLQRDGRRGQRRRPAADARRARPGRHRRGDLLAPGWPGHSGAAGRAHRQGPPAARAGVRRDWLRSLDARRATASSTTGAATAARVSSGTS